MPGRRALREVVGLYWESGLANDVPALAWFLVSSLVPLALGLTALAALILGDYAAAQALAARASGVLPADVHDQIVQLILRTGSDSPLVLAGSILGMVWISSGAIGVVDRCLARLLARESTGAVKGKLRNLGLAATLAVLIVLLVLVLIRIAAPLATLGVIVLICAGLYRVLALGSLSWRAGLAGGAVGGLVLLATPTAAGYYLQRVAGRKPVEVFLVLAGVLITCYLVALGLLLGSGVAVRVELGRQLGDHD